MQRARMLGNKIEHLATSKNLSITDLSEVLGCTETQMHLLLKGRVVASFTQISRIAEKLETSVQDLLASNKAEYNSTVIHCMNEFADDNNREFILDLMYDYMDIVDAVSAEK